MERFLKQHAGRLKGIISGFDRILFRGTLRTISYSEGIERWLWSEHVPLTQFGDFAEKVSKRLKEQAQQIARQQGRPFRHLNSPKLSKEEIATKILKEDGIQKGLICVLSCVEPSQSFELHKDRNSKTLKLVSRERPCLHLYFYYLDREFGLMHVRLQSWLPFTIQICVNGWEYLANRLQKAEIGFVKRDNCFATIDDLGRAQSMADALLRRNWVHWFDILAKRVNPWLDPKNGLNLHGYYWSIRQAEYSTDVLFANTECLHEVFPSLLNHAVENFNTKDVLRFLQRRANVNFSGEVKSDTKHRIEGVRIKHMVEENSIKMYDKQGSVLRIETTINNPRRWRVWRKANRKGKKIMAWIPMRKGVVDIERRAQLCRAANARYLEALSVVGETLPAREILDPVSQRVVKNGKAFRPLRPISPEDCEVLRIISSAEFILDGFRNCDIRERLGSGRGERARDLISASISRRIRLLRAHGLVAKISRTHRYHVTAKGHQVIATALKLRETNVLALAA